MRQIAEVEAERDAFAAEQSLQGADTRFGFAHTTRADHVLIVSGGLRWSAKRPTAT